MHRILEIREMFINNDDIKDKDSPFCLTQNLQITLNQTHNNVTCVKSVCRYSRNELQIPFVS